MKGREGKGEIWVRRDMGKERYGEGERGEGESGRGDRGYGIEGER